MVTNDEKMIQYGKRVRSIPVRNKMPVGIKQYECRHSGTLIVIGSSESALDEYKQAINKRPDAMVATIGHAAGFVKADFVISDHYEIHNELRKLQDQFGTGHYTTHATYSHLAKKYPAVDYWWRWRRSEASSLQTAVRIGLATGFDEIILCGCPLEKGTIQHPQQMAKDGFVWPPPRDIKKYGPKPGLNTSDEILASFRRHFIKYSLQDEWRGKVFSMSGFTRRILGPPFWIKHDRSEIVSAVKRWNGNLGVNAVYPSDSPQWPDDDAPDILRELCHGVVCDVGCGTGRCAEVFRLRRYIGIDINPKAISIAQKTHPNYKFDVVDWNDPYPTAHTYLFYTVLLHIPDCELLGVLSRTTWARSNSRIVIFETMDRKYRNVKAGNYQRNVNEYIDALNEIGKQVKDVRELPSNFRPYIRHFIMAE